MDAVAAEGPTDPRPQADGSLHPRTRTVLVAAATATLGLLLLLWANTLCLGMQGLMETRDPGEFSDYSGLLVVLFVLFGMGLATPAFMSLLSPSVPRLARAAAALVGLGLFAYTVLRAGGSTPLRDLEVIGQAPNLGLLTPTVALAVILVAALLRLIGPRHDPAPAAPGWVAGLLAVPVAAALWLLTAVAEYALRFAIRGVATRDWSGHLVPARTEEIGRGPAVAGLVAAGLLCALLLHHRVPSAALIVTGLVLTAGTVAGVCTVSDAPAGDAGFWSTLTAVPINGSAALLAAPLLVLGIVRRRFTRSPRS